MRQSAHMTVYSLPPQINSGESQPSQPPRLMDQIRAAIRTKHYSPRTEEAYLHWARQFILFHDKRHPLEMGEVEVGSFLEHLAVNKAVAASTQNQALNALVFLYGTVLRKPFGQLRDLTRAKRPKRLPTVLTQAEVLRLLSAMNGRFWLDGTIALRGRAAAHRVREPPHKRHRLQCESDSGARRQRFQRPRDHAS